METVWLETLEVLKSKISEQNISTWIKPIQPVKITGNLLTVEVPNKFIKDWILDNYKREIEETLSSVGTVNYTID
ncbi:MAG: chromosomal replication initiator protein DnaA, partial [Desulfuromusa sp.]|nr:chromosomal replication initiator protein DnaA [Desulfuromusa sp.]